VTTTAGYDYPVPEVTLPIRPVTTTTLPPIITQPAALYGAPAPPRRQGRRGRKLRRRRKVTKAEAAHEAVETAEEAQEE
jgi:hypothetical protein